MLKEFNVIIERDAEGYYVASVPSLRGCHTHNSNLAAHIVIRFAKINGANRLPTLDPTRPIKPGGFVATNRCAQCLPCPKTKTENRNTHIIPLLWIIR